MRKCVAMGEGQELVFNPVFNRNNIGAGTPYEHGCIDCG